MEADGEGIVGHFPFLSLASKEESEKRLPFLLALLFSLCGTSMDVCIHACRDCYWHPDILVSWRMHAASHPTPSQAPANLSTVPSQLTTCLHITSKYSQHGGWGHSAEGGGGGGA